MTSTNGVRVDCKDTYMITIRKHQVKDYVNKYMLDEVAEYLEQGIKSFYIIQQVYENSGMYKQLHYHAIAKVSKNFRYKPFVEYNGFQIQWTRVYDYFKACAYLLKDLRYKSQDDILLDNYYSINRFHEVYLT